MDDDDVLSGGNASGRVVRIGSTVRKPWTPATPSVIDFMAAVREAGVDVPRVIGRDDEGRLVLEFIPGTLAIDMPPLTREQLHRVGAMVRGIHDASARYAPPPGAVWVTAIAAPGHELVCHNDLAPWNLIVGDRWVFIDWDAAAPSTRLWDLAYAAQAFALNHAERAPEHAAADLATFMDGYGADAALRDALPTAMRERAEAMLALLRRSHAEGHEPWASMFTSGHGEHWGAVAAYVGRHQEMWLRG